jgi:hypothetical protein
VTAHSLVGLAGLNALYLLAGSAFLWLVRGAADWIDAARSSVSRTSRASS